MGKHSQFSCGGCWSKGLIRDGLSLSALDLATVAQGCIRAALGCAVIVSAIEPLHRAGLATDR